MPLVAHNRLPTFDRLRAEGVRVLAPDFALHQDIRELHIGLLNMMPDTALEATERQFLRLIGESNPIAQFYVHPFTLDELPRGDAAREHINKYYEPYSKIRAEGLDALIITGANVVGSELSNQAFWQPLIEVADWAHQSVTSTVCSCLATHAVLQFRYKQKRFPQTSKKWGVFPHFIEDKSHPLVMDINTRFDVPHSRWNTVTREQFDVAGLRVLVESDDGCVHLATSADGIRTVFFQGHPEYDTISLLKEYKREIRAFVAGQRQEYPPFPENYFGTFEKAVCYEHRLSVTEAIKNKTVLPEFPEELLSNRVDNTWRDTAGGVLGNWMGLIYQITHSDRRKPFMDHIDSNDPLNLKWSGVKK